ncbi:MAG: TIGR03960 family B12-binding radical SAM protein [Planctomycetota bacterium]|nr:MAG: TIGR03960 family B12-binding radical SAM protein [Planctomycetota bacterium]
MDELKKRVLREVLPLVSEPAQYIGGELNAVEKDHAGRLRFALAFPDSYTVGMSHLGVRILYDVLNRRDDVVCERVFCPAPDMESRLAELGLPLYTLESFTPLSDFDVVGFSLQYELCYTNVLTMLKLGGIPLLSRERGGDDPLVVAGGPCCGNPEPVADFFDAFQLGDGEETVLMIADLWRRYRLEEGLPREECLLRMAREIPGFYVPRFYEAEWNPDGTLRSVRPRADVPFPVRSALVMDLENAPFPERPIVPVLPVVHERITVEIMRGCLNGCRFCQAGMITRPQRYRSPDRIVEIARRNYEATGYDTISLLSLSTADYPGVVELIERLAAEFSALNVGISMPSLRIGRAMFELTERVGKVRKSGLTFAPETASDRMKGVINKMISEDDLIEGAAEAFRRGWRLVKLYFMIGLPGETADDRRALVRLSNRIALLKKEVGAGGPANVNVTVSTFVPKPHTPFQWARQMTLEEDLAARRELRKEGPLRSVKLKFEHAFFSQLEGLLARGDRKLCRTVLRAWELGARFDAWNERLDEDAWLKAMDEIGVSFDFYCARERPEDELLPWSHLSYGLSERFLLDEKRRAERGEPTPSCAEGPCRACLVDIACPNRRA